MALALSSKQFCFFHTLFTKIIPVFSSFEEGGVLINQWSRTWLQETRFHLRAFACAKMINSRWVCRNRFPAAVSQFIWTFQTAKHLTQNRHHACKLWTHLCWVFFSHPRTSVFRGSHRIKPDIDWNHLPCCYNLPLFPPHLAYPASRSHTS